MSSKPTSGESAVFTVRLAPLSDILGMKAD
jgi:hypothetical protein